MYIVCLDSQFTSSTQIKHQWQENTIRKHNFPICPCASVLLQKVSDWILTGQDRSVGYTPPRYWFCIAWQQKRSNRPTLSWICIVFFPAVSHWTQSGLSTDLLPGSEFEGSWGENGVSAVDQRFSRVWSATKRPDYSIRFQTILSFKNSTLDKCQMFKSHLAITYNLFSN